MSRGVQKVKGRGGHTISVLQGCSEEITRLAPKFIKSLFHVKVQQDISSLSAGEISQ